MKFITKLSIFIIFVQFCLPACFANPTAHKITDWNLSPSFKFDTLCLLNTLTGDPFYLEYYKEEYAKFEPRLTPAARTALSNLNRRIKKEAGGIISAFFCLYFSATNDQTLDEMLRTLEDPSILQKNLKNTQYYDSKDWQLFEANREDLETILKFLKEIEFDAYWKENVLPKTLQKIEALKSEFPKYDIVPVIESHLGFPLSSNKIDVHMLYYSQPHGIKITGTRFLTDVAWPFKIVLRNAIHEMMHPPYAPNDSEKLNRTLDLLKQDKFLMEKISAHNRSFGYNSFEGFIEEDCVQALEQVINEHFQVGVEPHQRWKENDDGMHVFAVALYSVMKSEDFNRLNETFSSFLIKMIQTGELSPNRVKPIYDSFYSQQ